MTTFSHEGFYVAFDTSGQVASVAVAKGTQVLARATLERQGDQAARLVPSIRDILSEAGVDRTEIAGVIVGEGPGSFTGVRVAAATAKGLVHARQCPLWAISSLAATALSLEGSGIRYVLFDARADRVYGGCYGIGSIGVETLVPPHGGSLRDVLDDEVPAGAVFVGAGASQHRAAIEGAGFPVAPDPVAHPSGDGLLRYLALHPVTAPVESVSTWEPRYIREWRPDAAWKG